MIEEIISRACLIYEEFDHVKSRYDETFDIFKHAFEFPKLSILVFLICLISLMYLCTNYGTIQLDLGYGLYFFLIAALLCVRLLKLVSLNILQFYTSTIYCLTVIETP